MCYQYVFKDGYVCLYSFKMKKADLRNEVMKHGDCISITKVG